MVESLGAELAAISVDQIHAQRVFAAALGGLPYTVLSDWHRRVAADYGVYDAERAFARRAVFVIGRDSTVTFANLSFAAGNPAHYESVLEHLRGAEPA